MIFVSSACVKADKISDSVIQLAEFGFKNIELSGGTTYYANYLEDLQELRTKYGLIYLIHNYFPPPQKDFVINLASCDQEHLSMSIDHCKKAIDDCKELGIDKYSFHAGFLINIPLNEVGEKIEKKSLFDREEAMQNFMNSLEILDKYAGADFKLYVENNVLSEGNYNRFNHQNPFFLTSLTEYQELKSMKEFNLLLDLAHLKVSANSLGNDFMEEALLLESETDYIHISDNNGKLDSNKGLNRNSEMYDLLKRCDLNQKTITLEIYDGLSEVAEAEKMISELTISN